MVSNRSRIVISVICGLPFLIESYSRYGLSPYLVLGIICVILVIIMAWYWLKILFIKDHSNRDLAVAAITAIVASVFWMIMSGPGYSYYYRYVYPLGESEVKTGVSGSLCLSTTFVGIGALVYSGWIKAKSKGWKQITYAWFIAGLFIVIFIISTLIMMANLMNM